MKISIPLLGLAAFAHTSVSGHAFADDARFRTRSAGSSRASIVERTPFAKSDKNDKKTSAGGPLELRGFYGSKDALEVSLTRPETKEAAWVRVGDKSAKWVVDEADPVAGTAEVRFDGLQLHLRLAQPEQPEAVAEPEAKPQDDGAKRPGRGRWGNMSKEGRDAMRTAMRAAFDAARAEHPEYFNNTGQLTAEQQAARTAYMQANYEKVRAEVAKSYRPTPRKCRRKRRSAAAVPRSSGRQRVRARRADETPRPNRPPADRHFPR